MILIRNSNDLNKLPNVIDSQENDASSFQPKQQTMMNSNVENQNTTSFTPNDDPTDNESSEPNQPPID